MRRARSGGQDSDRQAVVRSVTRDHVTGDMSVVLTDGTQLDLSRADVRLLWLAFSGPCVCGCQDTYFARPE